MTFSLVLVLGLVATAHAQTQVPVATDQGKAAVPAAPLPPELALGPDAEAGAPPDGGPKQWWVSADYLFGWVRGSNLPPLVTTSPQGTARESAGVLGQPGTSIVFGNSVENNDLRSGFRLGAGGWFSEERCVGFDAGFFFLESQDTPFFASSQGNPILARPFLDATTNAQTSQLVAFPGVFSGSVGVSAQTSNFYGAHADMEEVIVAKPWCRVASLLGYRFLRFDDGLTVQQNVVALGGGVLAQGTQINTLDRFTAENEFHGLDLGIRADLCYQQLSLGLLAKVAVGGIHREVTISGATQTTVPGSAPTSSQGGFLALSSNIGTHSSDDWVVAPELGVTLGWDLTCNLRLRLGYSVIFWTDVARASEQVDLTINPNLFPPPVAGATPSHPAFVLQKADLWVQTVNLGVEYRF
jgi:hypothetical protein